MCEIYFTDTPAKIKISQIHEYFNYGYYSEQIGELIVRMYKTKYITSIFTNSKKEHMLYSKIF